MNEHAEPLAVVADGEFGGDTALGTAGAAGDCVSGANSLIQDFHVGFALIDHVGDQQCLGGLG